MVHLAQLCPYFSETSGDWIQPRMLAFRRVIIVKLVFWCLYYNKNEYLYLKKQNKTE